MKEKIFLIGFMGSGKSAIGSDLAIKNNLKFIDIDEEIEKRTGQKIVNIFNDYGQDYFRKFEKKVLIEIIKNENIVVVATGGGIVLDEENRRLMKEAGKVIYLKASKETLYRRLKKSKFRPLLNVNNKKDEISRILDNRQNFYSLAADISIQVDNKSIKEIIEEINKALE